MPDFFPDFYDAKFKGSPDTLWLRVRPKEFRPNIQKQTGANEGSIVDGIDYRFLLSGSVNIGIDHTWTSLDTISGEIRNLKANVSKAVAQAGAAGGSSAGNIFSQGISSKNDNPFIYEDTQRRTVNIELKFATYKDASKEVWTPIQNLMRWSCAESTESGSLATNFKFPYVFELRTVTGSGELTGMINIPNAALTQILPTYEAPYKNGYPMSATVSVTFSEIDPVYRSSLVIRKSKVSSNVQGG